MADGEPAASQGGEDSAQEAATLPRLFVRAMRKHDRSAVLLHRDGDRPRETPDWQIVENMYMVAQTKEWFETRGKHKIYAGDRPMQVGGARKLPVVSDAPAAVPGAHVTTCS